MFKQSGVVPYRLKDGQIEILLITSSKGKRWVIPKGWVDPYLSSAESAAKEAREEAGVVGFVMTPAIGTYKRRKMGVACPVEVFVMKVEMILEDWLEADVRQRQWLSVAEASRRIKESELKRIFKLLEQLLSALA